MKVVSPLNDYVLVARKEEEKMTLGGLHIPSTAATASLEATVIAAGPGRMLETGVVGEMRVKAGDTVLLPKTGMDLKYDGKEYVMIQEYQILAIISDDGK